MWEMSECRLGEAEWGMQRTAACSDTTLQGQGLGPRERWGSGCQWCPSTAICSWEKLRADSAEGSETKVK